jgi:cysteine desulfurase
LISRYFDNAATTPLDPTVLSEMLPFLEGDFGNASSIHRFGRRAEAAVDLARERVAGAIGADDPSQVFFTSGATEANNWLLRGFSDVAVSPFEHSSIFETAHDLGQTILPPNLQPVSKHGLISVMAVNNETGSTYDVGALRSKAALLHTDATQALGKVSFSVEEVDFASFSAHKLYGPKGVGVLYVRDDPPTPLLKGGEQESSFRAGTLNVPGIVGFGVAAELAMERFDEETGKARELRAALLEELEPLADWRLVSREDASPFILSVSFFGVEGETLVIECDSAGYAISAGAACSSRSTEPSHVLTAMGLDESWRRGTVRISFGRFNTLEAARGLGQVLAQSAKKLRTMS